MLVGLEGVVFFIYVFVECITVHRAVEQFEQALLVVGASVAHMNQVLKDLAGVTAVDAVDVVAADGSADEAAVASAIRQRLPVGALGVVDVFAILTQAAALGGHVGSDHANMVLCYVLVFPMK